MGKIYKNSNLGIYGTLNNISTLNLNFSNEIPIARRNEIKLGKAKILCNLEGNNIEEYEVEIENIYLNNDYDNKSMLIKIQDSRLLDKTGGIIQGMSGSPIIQNNKLVGAITNVLVNDPTRGYGVFGDIMIKEMTK